MQRHVEIDGVQLTLSKPNENTGQWIGQQEILKQLLACWLVVDEQDLPLTPRLVGTPGIGKTALAMAAARQRKQELYHLPVHGRHAAGGSAGHAGAGRERQDRLSRLAAGDGHDPRRRLHSRRRQPDEREVVGQPGAAARSSPVRRVDRRGHHDPRPSRLPLRRDDEPGRIDLRDSRLHPEPLAADAARSAFPNRRDELAILQYHLPFAEAGDAGADGRVSAAVARA